MEFLLARCHQSADDHEASWVVTSGMLPTGQSATINQTRFHCRVGIVARDNVRQPFFSSLTSSSTFFVLTPRYPVNNTAFVSWPPLSSSQPSPHTSYHSQQRNTVKNWVIDLGLDLSLFKLLNLFLWTNVERWIYSISQLTVQRKKYHKFSCKHAQWAFAAGYLCL